MTVGLSEGTHALQSRAYHTDLKEDDMQIVINKLGAFFCGFEKCYVPYEVTIY